MNATLKVELHWPDDLQQWLIDAGGVAEVISVEAQDGRTGVLACHDDSIRALLWMIGGADEPATAKAMNDRAAEDDWPVRLVAASVDLDEQDVIWDEKAPSPPRQESPAKADCLSLWRFPEDQYPGWLAAGMGDRPLAEYRLLLAATADEARRQGLRVIWCTAGVDEVLAELDRMGLHNTPDGRAAAIGSLALKTLREKAAAWSVEDLAAVLHAATYRSRRQAKRLLREMLRRPGSSDELDAALLIAETHERVEEISRIAGDLERRRKERP